MRIALFAAMLCNYSVAISQVRKIAAETSIRNVTIFYSGARIERSATLAVLPGRSEISFSGLSNQLEQQSVQLKANANITLLSVQSTKDFISERKVEQDERNLIDRNNVLKDKLLFDEKLYEVYKNEEAMLIKNQAIGGQAGVKTTELKEALDLQRQRLTEVYQKQLEIEKRMNDERQDTDKYTMQLQEISKKKDSVNYTVTALIDSKDTKSVTFQLLYNVKDAGWYPAYNVRITNVIQPLQVLMNANVFQRSGETWKDVSVLLSSGNPNDNATPSQLQPWMLGFYDPSVSFRSTGIHGEVSGRVTDESGEPIASASIIIKGTRNGTVTDANGFFKIQNYSGSGIVAASVGYVSKEVHVTTGYITISLKPSTTALNDVVVSGYGLQGRTAGLDVIEDEPLKEHKKESLLPVNVATQYQPTTTIYKIDEKYTLETDGKTTTIGIREFEVPALYDYFSAPKIDPAAFLTAKIINWQDYDLQSGEASLYFEGTYLGKTYIDLSSVADTLSLSLGKDNGIKIYRKLVKEFSTKRFIGSNRTETKNYEIIVRNTKHETISITITDQFPVSTTKEINVDDQKAPEATIDKESGIVSWMVKLQPGEEKKLSVSYSVKYPKDKKVVLE